jgi:tRNA threonylcarbamoyladenosine biosynthesis protein TsaB
VQVEAQPAPDIIWVAWLGAAVEPSTAPPKPYYLRAPDAKPSQQALASQPAAS